MYKVFFNQTCLILAEKSEIKGSNEQFEKSETLNGIQKLNKMKEWLSLGSNSKVILTKNVEIAWNEFLSNFKLVEAAGGLVQNQNHELLTIFRNKKWDLPKGKLEKGETIAECAIREVEEETGVVVLHSDITKPQITYHVYEHKGRLVLKPTYWYKMSAQNQHVKPQLEEGIEEVKWMNRAEIEQIFMINTYPTLKDLIE